MSLLGRFYRWRASRGYGIHSPLAYTLVKRVIRPERDAIYYGEEALEATPVSLRLREHARMVLRLIAFLQPAYVWTSPGCPEIFFEAIRMGGGVVRIYDGEVFPDDYLSADLILLDHFHLKKRDLKAALSSGKALLAFDMKAKWINSIAASVKSGIALEGVNSMLAVGRNEGEAHIYKIAPF